jgi:glutamine amidotransferase
MIALVNYEAGNIRSVTKALEKCGGSIQVTDRADDIRKADKVILPGVGAFGKAMEALTRFGLTGVLQEAAVEKPFLGICVGLQLLFEFSEESPGVRGLSILKGKVCRFPTGVKIPHLGWNQVKQVKRSALWQNLPDRQFYYFANSYYAEPGDPDVIAGMTDYNVDFTSAVSRDQLFGVQFHPEKSQKWGLKILENFIRL